MDKDRENRELIDWCLSTADGDEVGPFWKSQLRRMAAALRGEVVLPRCAPGLEELRERFVQLRKP